MKELYAVKEAKKELVEENHKLQKEIEDLKERLKNTKTESDLNLIAFEKLMEEMKELREQD